MADQLDLLMDEVAYDTPLSVQEEEKFQTWKAQMAPKDSGADYDLRGAFKAGVTPDPETKHWPDTFKKPNHPTFSDQSQYYEKAPEKAGRWEGDKFIPPEKVLDQLMDEADGTENITAANDISQKVYDPDGGKTLEVPGWYHPGLVGDAIRKNFHPEQEDVSEIGRAFVRNILVTGQAVGEVVRYVGDHIGSSPAPFTKKSEGVKKFEKSIQDFILDQGDLMVNTYKNLQQTMKINGVEMTKANPDIWRGSFMDNPSYTRGIATVMSAVTSLGTAYAITVATKNPLAGAVALGLIDGSLQRGEAREAGASKATQDTVFYLSTIGTTVLEKLPLTRFFEGGKGKVAGAVGGFFVEGLTEAAQQYWQNTIAKFGYEPTRAFTEGVLESFIVGAATGGVFGGFTSHNAARVDSAITKLKLAGATDAEIEKMGYNAAVHLAENSKAIDQNFRELMQSDYIPSITKGLSPEKATEGAVAAAIGKEGAFTPVEITSDAFASPELVDRVISMHHLIKSVSHETKQGELGITMPSFGLPRSVRFDSVIVSPEYRKQGLGTKWSLDALAQLQKSGTQYIEASTTKLGGILFNKLEQLGAIKKIDTADLVEQGLLEPEQAQEAAGMTPPFEFYEITDPGKAKETFEQTTKPLPSEASQAPIAETTPEVQQLSETPTDEKAVEGTLPKIVSDLQTITAKINEQSRTGRPEESLVRRQKELIDVLENLKSEEQAQPNPGIKKLIRVMTGQTELVPKEVTEMSALKASLQAQQRAAANAARVAINELTDLKKGIVDTIKVYVPKEAQGKLLTAVADAKNGADLFKAMDRMERIAEDANRKTLLKELKKEIKKVEASSVIAIDYVNKIRDLVAQYDLGKMSDETRSKLEKTQAFLQRERAAGRDVSIPQYVLYQLQGLYRQSSENLDSNSLRNLISTIKLLKEVGRTKLRAKQALEAAIQSQALIELTAGSKKMETLPIARPRVGEELPKSVQRNNKVNSALNWAAQKNLAITPIDVIMDMLDGGSGYTGPNSRIFKRTIDDAFSVYLGKKDVAGKKITDLAKKLELDTPDFEKVGFFAAAQQEGGVEKLMNLGYTEEEIAAVTLDEKQTELYETMREELDKLRPEIAEVMKDVYNADFAEVKNYFPFITDFEAMSDLEIKDRFMLGAPEMGQFKRVNVEKGFALQRTGAGKQKIKLDAMQVYLQHLDNAAYLTTIGRHTKRLSDIARSEQYLEAVGDRGQAFMMDWLDTIARKGRKSGDKIRFMDTLRKNIGFATLGFRLTSALIQPSSLMDGAGLIGPAAFEGAGLIAKEKAWRKFVFDNMAEVRDRIGDDPFYMEFGETSILDKTGRASFWALQKLDMLAAASIASGAYLKYMRDNGLEIDLSKPNADGLAYAQLIVRRSQASAFFKDVPQAMSRGALTGNSSVDRLILQFQTFMLNRWSLFAHDAVGLGFQKGNLAKGINVTSYLLLAKIAELGVRGLSKELLNLITGDDKEEKDGFTEQAILSLLSDIPFVGQIAAPFIYGGIPVPAIQMISRTTERLNGVVTSKSGEAKARNAVRAAILILGAMGMPGATQTESIVGKMTAPKGPGGRKRIAY